MHRAPAVSFPVMRSRWHMRLLVAALAFSAIASTAFIGSGASSGPRSALVLLAMGGAAVFAGVQWVRTPSGVLHWDGGQWLWESASQSEPCTVQPKLDFQQAVVVRVRCGSGASRYHWIEAGAAPQHWLALRRALVSQSLHPLVPTDEAPANGLEGRP